MGKLFPYGVGVVYCLLTLALFKLLGNRTKVLRTPQTWKHCCGNIVARNVSTASKRVGSKTNVLLPCRANQETFVADAKCF